jgi:hypothetical protein
MTYHAEDGSGVGSAIIAGTSPSQVHNVVLTLHSFLAMTKIRKDAGLYVDL